MPEDESVITETPDEAKADGDAAAPKKEARKLVKDEEREVGNVSWKTYSVRPHLASRSLRSTTALTRVSLPSPQLYFRASNYYLWALSLVLMLISNNASILERVWIRTWTSAYPGQKQPPHEQFTTSVFAHHDHHAAVFAANGHVVPQQAFAISGFSPASNQSFAAAAYPPADTRPFFYIGIWSGASRAAPRPERRSEADCRRPCPCAAPCSDTGRDRPGIPDPDRRRLLGSLSRVGHDPRRHAAHGHPVDVALGAFPSLATRCRRFGRC